MCHPRPRGDFPGISGDQTPAYCLRDNVGAIVNAKFGLGSFRWLRTVSSPSSSSLATWLPKKMPSFFRWSGHTSLYPSSTCLIIFASSTLVSGFMAKALMPARAAASLSTW